MPLNIFKKIIFCYAVFLSLGFFLKTQAKEFALYNWIISNDVNKISAIVVYNDIEVSNHYSESFNIYRPESFKKSWGALLRIKRVSWTQFLKEYENVALYNEPEKITLLFFANDGMLLFDKQFSPEELPEWRDYWDLKKALAEYLSFKASGKSKRSAFYWPYKAYLSNLKQRALVWLKEAKINSNQEKIAAQNLLTLILRIN